MTTTNELTGRVPGDTLAQQAVFLAGLLAEQSALSLVLTHEGGSRMLNARRDDLPSLVEAAAASSQGARLRCEALDLTAHLHAAGLQWRTGRPATAALLGSP